MKGKLKTGLTLLTVVATALLMGATEEPPQIAVTDLVHDKVVLMGELGQRVGTFMTVEGVAGRPWMGPGLPVVIDTVDGKKLAQTVTIGVEPAPQLSQGTRCVLRGYESVGMVGIAVDPRNKTQGHGVQQPLQLGAWFEVKKIVEPANLKQDGK